MVGVAGVVSPDDDHEVERLPGQLEDRVLALLGRGADRVEGPKPLRGLLAVAVLHGAAQFLRDGERLRREHRRLVGEADPLQVSVRVESG